MYSKKSGVTPAHKSYVSKALGQLTEGAPTPNTDNVAQAEELLGKFIYGEIIEEQTVKSKHSQSFQRLP